MKHLGKYIGKLIMVKIDSLLHDQISLYFGENLVSKLLSNYNQSFITKLQNIFRNNFEKNHSVVNINRY